MSKNRSLKAVIRRLGKIDHLIRQVIDEKGHANVLEVGCGYGLPMLELKKKFGGKISLTGINKDARFNLPRKAIWEGIKQWRFPPWEALTHQRRFGFPTYVNCDASLMLPFDDDSFDFVYCIATTWFLLDKIHFLEQLNRILQPDCVARIHFSHSAIEAGHYAGAPDLNYENLCEIRDQRGVVLDTEEYLQRFKCISFTHQTNGKPTYLQLKKETDELDLGLNLVESCWLTDINPNWIPYARGVYCHTRTAFVV